MKRFVHLDKTCLCPIQPCSAFYLNWVLSFSLIQFIGKCAFSLHALIVKDKSITPVTKLHPRNRDCCWSSGDFFVYKICTLESSNIIGHLIIIFKRRYLLQNPRRSTLTPGGDIPPTATDDGLTISTICLAEIYVISGTHW